MLSHRDMRQILAEAFRQRFGREGSRCELQCLQAVAWLETSYAAGWKGEGAGSWNFGACQAGRSWTGETFLYTDTHPKSDGTNVPYTVAFRKYPSAVAGAADLVKIVYVNAGRAAALSAARAENTFEFSRVLHATRYYEGFGATVGERIAHHHSAVVAAIRRQCTALGEDLPSDIKSLPAPRRTLRLGSKGPDVRELQEFLRAMGADLTIDGGFGPKTLKALESFQASRSLTVDGVCGPKTWKALEGARPS